MRRPVIVAWLVWVWITLWEVTSWANLLGGLAVAACVLYLLPPHPTERRIGFRPLATLRLFFYFNLELIKASSLVAWEVITPRNRIGPAVVSIGLRSDVAGVITTVANMVSLTPGTVTLDVDEENRTIFVHVLHFKSLEATRKSVNRLEDLILSAFPSRPVMAEEKG